MSSSTWVFGYGSLVSTASLATTIERTVGTNDVAVAHLHGFARRWNYGSLSVRGEWHHAGVNVTDGCMVALGLVVAEAIVLTSLNEHERLIYVWATTNHLFDNFNHAQTSFR